MSMGTVLRSGDLAHQTVNGIVNEAFRQFGDSAADRSEGSLLGDDAALGVDLQVRER